MSRVAYATIDVSALKHNLSVVKKTAPHSKILAVIKAHAYGHGLLRVAKSLDDADAFAIAHCEEAVTLRENKIQKRTVALQGFSDSDELEVFVEQNIEPVIYSLEQVELLEKAKLSESFNIWLKIDTGMHRLGFAVEDVESIWNRLNAIPALKNNICLMTHFANADEEDNSLTLSQIELFEETIANKVALKSMANSGAILNCPESHVDWVRPGLMLYGASPLNEVTAEALDLRPVMTLKSRIIAINHLKKGECVGYGSTWCPMEDSRIAVVGIGYGDGYPRHIKENTPVLINGQQYPIVGRVSMDMLCVEIGKDELISTGQEVILWGAGLPAEIIAEKARTISYELFCQVTSRVRLETINE